MTLKTLDMRRALYLAISVIFLLYLLPFLILQDQSYITIHDNLDCEFAYLHLLSETGLAFDFSRNAVLENIMGGIPRIALRSGLSFSLLLYSLFNSLTAYIINHILVHLIGFLGMYMLVKNHFIRGPDRKTLSAGIALCFALVPYYSSFGISVSGQPLLLYVFLNLLHGKQRWYEYLIIVVFPFYSLLVLSGPFFLAMLSIMLVHHVYIYRRIPCRFMYGAALLCLSYAVVEFQLITSMFFSGAYVSHREEWASLYALNKDVMQSLVSAKNVFLYGQYHSGLFWTMFILLSAGMAMYLSLKQKKMPAGLVTLLSFIAVISLFYGFYPQVKAVLKDLFPIVVSFNFSRFSFLLPLLWFIVFAVSLSQLNQKQGARFLLPIFIIVQLAVVVSYDREYRCNIRQLMGNENPGQPNFRRFFAVELFEDIKRHIDRPQHSYRVGSIGLHPSISQYNGFYTIDGYQDNYPLEYKKRFRKIIARELEKDQALKRYFIWGNRCYLFSAEVGRNYLVNKDAGEKVKNLQLDIEAFRALGGEYILSSVEIDNVGDKGLELEGTFTSPNAYWKIHLYNANHKDDTAD